jgi:hypothetical protein
MNTLFKIIDKYAAFEAEVRSCMSKISGDQCCVCKAVCCQPEFCEESLSSPFLKCVRRHFVPDAVYDAANGWLTPAGCALPVGRPPVCYQFFCRAILATQLTAQFERQLNEAANAFDLVRAYLDGEIAELHPSPTLMKISTVPVGLFAGRSGRGSGRPQSKRTCAGG